MVSSLGYVLRSLSTSRRSRSGLPDRKLLLTAPETARRVQTAAIEAIARSGFGVQGYREKVESLLPEPFFVDKAGILKRRGAPAPGQPE